MKKDFANVILIAVIVILLGLVGYVAFVKKAHPTAQETAPTRALQENTPTVLPPTTPVAQNTPPSLPTTCKDESEGVPVITSLSSDSASVEEKIEIRGCNFSGFEGDKNAWIENREGIKGIFYGEAGSTSKFLKLTLKSPLCQRDNSYSALPCDAWLTLSPGVYKIYTMPWGKKSNEVNFTIK